MERKRLLSGKIKSAGYDEKSRTLELEFEGGDILQYAPFAPEMYRRFSSSSSPWSYYQDNIEGEYLPKRAPREGKGSVPDPFS
jgi:hypothetical protein